MWPFNKVDASTATDNVQKGPLDTESLIEACKRAAEIIASGPSCEQLLNAITANGRKLLLIAKFLGNVYPEGNKPPDIIRPELRETLTKDSEPPLQELANELWRNQELIVDIISFLNKVHADKGVTMRVPD